MDMYNSLQAQARMRQLAKEAAAAQDPEEAFVAKVKKGKGKGKGKGRGKGKGGRGKGKGRGKAKQLAEQEFDEETGNYMQDLDGEQNEGNEHEEEKDLEKMHSTPSSRSPKPPAIRRLALLRSKSKSSGSLQKAKASKSAGQALPTKRQLSFEEGAQHLSVNSKPRKYRRNANTEQKEQQAAQHRSRKRKTPAEPPASPMKKQQDQSECDPRQTAKEPSYFVFLLWFA